MQKSVDIPLRAKKLLLILDTEKSLGFLDLFHFRLSFLIKYESYYMTHFYVSHTMDFLEI